MRKSAFALVLLAPALSLSSVLSANIAITPALADETELHGPDTQFLAKAILAGRSEVEFSQLAAGKATRPEVRQFAEKMVREHTAMNEKLVDEAQRRKIKLEGTYGTPPLRPTQETEATKQQLQSLSGEQLDRSYIQKVIQDHLHAIAEYQDEAKNGKDTPIRNVAEAALPSLQGHLKQAQEIGRHIGVDN
jgi:putative membrane protein